MATVTEEIKNGKVEKTVKLEIIEPSLVHRPVPPWRAERPTFAEPPWKKRRLETIEVRDPDPVKLEKEIVELKKELKEVKVETAALEESAKKKRKSRPASTKSLWLP